MNGNITKNRPKSKKGIVTIILIKEPIPIHINLIIKLTDFPKPESSWNKGSDICLAIGRVFVRFKL